MGRGKRDKIYLSAEQRQSLEEISRNGHAPTQKIVHAQVLLMSEQREFAPKPRTDDRVAIALNLYRQVRKRSPVTPKINGHTEAQIIALCCSQPPDSRNH